MDASRRHLAYAAAAERAYEAATAAREAEDADRALLEAQARRAEDAGFAMVVGEAS